MGNDGKGGGYTGALDKNKKDKNEAKDHLA